MKKGILSVIAVAALVGLGWYVWNLTQKDFICCKVSSVEMARMSLKSSNPEIRYLALLQLQELGPEAEPAIADLVKLLEAEDEDSRLNAALALGKIGKAAVPSLAIPLSSADDDVRYHALSAAGWIGPYAKALTPQVIACLKRPSADVRRKAAYALGTIAAAPEESVPALVNLLDDNDHDVRLAATEALPRFGAQAVPALVKALQHPKEEVRVTVIRTLGALGADAKDAVPELRAALLDNAILNDPGSATQLAAAEALAKIGSVALPALRDGLGSPQPGVRQMAVQALGQAGGDGVPLLVDALGHAKLDVRMAAARVLGQLGVRDKMVVLGLAYALQDENVEFRNQVGQTLEGLRPDSPEVFKKLTQLANDPNAGTRLSARNVLVGLATGAYPGVSAQASAALKNVREK